MTTTAPKKPCSRSDPGTPGRPPGLDPRSQTLTHEGRSGI
ncbi:hypothetical protein Pd630_LPD02812 [Rhodococcus opacus PD630]|nr:hypothetical protein Pd630_LPD02812 [Rhodococcus opacus PD630]